MEIDKCKGAMLPEVPVNVDKHGELFRTALECVSSSTGIDCDSILGVSRKRPIADARMMLYKIARDEIGSRTSGYIPTFEWIANQFAPPKDHGTVLHGVKQLCDRIETSKLARRQFVEALMEYEYGRSVLLKDDYAYCVSAGAVALRKTVAALRCKMQEDADTLELYMTALSNAEGRGNESMVQDKLASDG